MLLLDVVLNHVGMGHAGAHPLFVFVLFAFSRQVSLCNSTDCPGAHFADQTCIFNTGI